MYIHNGQTTMTQNTEHKVRLMEYHPFASVNPSAATVSCCVVGHQFMVLAAS